jgi:hypothetical protein
VIPGHESFQHIAEVDQEIVYEPPGDEGVEPTRARTRVQHRALGESFGQRLERTLEETGQFDVSFSPAHDGDDAPEANSSRAQRDQGKRNKQDLFNRG